MDASKPGYIFAEEIVVGSRIIPPGRVRAVEVFQEAYCSNPDDLLFVCIGQGPFIFRIKRGDQVRTG